MGDCAVMPVFRVEDGLEAAVLGVRTEIRRSKLRSEWDEMRSRPFSMAVVNVSSLDSSFECESKIAIISSELVFKSLGVVGVFGGEVTSASLSRIEKRISEVPFIASLKSVVCLFL